jgi:cell fate regulator YaaT (PSP1 superfamily)
MSQQETAPSQGQKEKDVVLVRYGSMGHLGWFKHKLPHIRKTETRVVIKTERGLELGDIVGPHCYKGGHFRCDRKGLEDYYENRSRDFPLAGGGTLVRYATKADVSEEKHLETSAKEEMTTAQKYAGEMKLDMKMVECEHVFGGERIIMYFTSPGRIDFRDLVKKLAREYQTRIELRQIGARDEARLISDYESCGQECCCRRYLKILAPVNMRMAKVQKATLDPSKISGHCGRLKCCLRYEDDTYKDLKKNLPKKNTWVETSTGKGRVIDGQILTQLVIVEYENGKRDACPVDDIKAIERPENQPQQRPSGRRGGGRPPERGQGGGRDGDRNSGGGRGGEKPQGGGRKNEKPKPKQAYPAPDTAATEPVTSENAGDNKPAEQTDQPVKPKRKRNRRRKKKSGGENRDQSSSNQNVNSQSDSNKNDDQMSGGPKVETQSDSTQSESQKVDSPKVETQGDSTRNESQKIDSPNVERQSDSTQSESQKIDSSNVEKQSDSTQSESQKIDSSNVEKQSDSTQSESQDTQQ